jgi:hypothetical protein
MSIRASRPLVQSRLLQHSADRLQTFYLLKRLSLVRQQPLGIRKQALALGIAASLELNTEKKFFSNRQGSPIERGPDDLVVLDV